LNILVSIKYFFNCRGDKMFF